MYVCILLFQDGDEASVGQRQGRKKIEAIRKRLPGEVVAGFKRGQVELLLEGTRQVQFQELFATAIDVFS
jgi:hypothetical protein